MTKLPTTTKSTNEVVPIKPLPFFRALDQLVDNADRIVRRYDEVEHLFRQLNEGRQPNLADCKQAATVSKYDQELLARCEAALKQFDPTSAYQDNDPEFGNLRPSLIAEQIALLIDSKPTGRPPNPQVYTTMMMEDLLAVEDLSLIALITACREVRQAKPYVPDISDLMPVLRKHLQAWEERRWAISSLANESRRFMARIEALEIEALETAKARLVRQRAAAKAWAVQTARQNLRDAQAMLSGADADLAEKQEEVEKATIWFAQCQAEVLKMEQALAEAERLID